MKTFVAIIILFVLALCVLNSVVPPQDMGIWFNGVQVNGPLETLVGLILAGGGILVAAVALVAVAMLVALLFAGLGVVVLGLLALVAVVVALAISPLMLPFLLIGAVLWYSMSRRERRERTGRFSRRADASHHTDADLNAKA